MKFESRFDLEQPVWSVHTNRVDFFVECPSCSGGTVPLPDGRTLTCPRCAGKGTISRDVGVRSFVGAKMVIGQIRVCVGGDREDDSEQYMTYQTRVGSGSLYHPKNLFVSPEAAQKECEIRNREPGKLWRCVQCHPDYEKVQYIGYNDWQWCSVHNNRTNHVDVEKVDAIIEKRKQFETEE